MKPDDYAPGERFTAAGPAGPVDPADWGEPLPLYQPGEADPYPVDALPPMVAAAVEEVRAYVQAPVALVACSALSALSLAGQGLVDVERDTRLVGPVGLYLLAVAESGERKSTCDGYFTRPIAEWERDEAERLRPDVEAAERERATWAAKRAGVLEAVKAAAKGGKDTAELDRKLAALGSEPERVRVPDVRQADLGPEALGFHLATEWPSAGMLSNEAGQVLGGHGMGDKSLMRNLAVLNTLWDGGGYKAKRRTSESFAVTGARLTVGLMAQPATLRDFMANGRELVRGTGFLARFLVAAPATTQGSRPYREPPAAWPALDRYGLRLRELLDTPPNWQGNGLAPPRLPFTTAGKAVWVDAFNAVERELRAGGECADVKDVASKALDNAARLAGLFHLAEHGPAGAIGDDDATRGVKLALWHLGEAGRVLNGVAPPLRVLDAERLEQWLVDRAAEGERPGRREAQNGGPLRNGNRLNAALDVLAERNRVREVTVGKAKLLLLNPALGGGAP